MCLLSETHSAHPSVLLGVQCRSTVGRPHPPFDLTSSRDLVLLGVQCRSTAGRPHPTFDLTSRGFSVGQLLAVLTLHLT